MLAFAADALFVRLERLVTPWAARQGRGPLMDEIIAFFTDPANWEGTRGIPNRLFEHLVISGLAIARRDRHRPADRAVHRPHRARREPRDQPRQHRPGRAVVRDHGHGPAAVTLGARAGPRLLAVARASTSLPILIAMTLLAIPPILVSAYAGLRSVDRDLIEAARGMGLRERQILRQIELPIASPIIVGGFRTATLQVIATATIGAILSGGGLGRFIFDGLSQGRPGEPSIYAGAILVTVLAVGVDLVLALVQRRLDAARPCAKARGDAQPRRRPADGRRREAGGCRGRRPRRPNRHSRRSRDVAGKVRGRCRSQRHE